MSVGELRSVQVGAPPMPRPRLGYVPLVCGALLIPWLVVLASGAAPQWTAVWLALDSLEAVGLVSTGLLALLAKPALTPAAAATAALLVLDASLDLVTSHDAAARLAAVAMALLAELPLAAACAVLALRRAD